MFVFAIPTNSQSSLIDNCTNHLSNHLFVVANLQEVNLLDAGLHTANLHHVTILGIGLNVVREEPGFGLKFLDVLEKNKKRFFPFFQF